MKRPFQGLKDKDEKAMKELTVAYPHLLEGQLGHLIRAYVLHQWLLDKE